MPATDSGLRRVSIHAGSAAADLVLPAEIPLAVLTPTIVDILEVSHAHNRLTAKRYHLSLPGSSPLDPSKSLAQSGIGDGTVLLLSQPPAEPPAPRHHDTAEAMAEALAAASEPSGFPARLAGAVAAGCVIAVGALALARNALVANAPRTAVGVLACAGLVALLSAVVAHRAYRDAVAGLTLGAMAAAFAAVAGLLVVPGPPGICNVLLAATAAAATCVVAMRVSGCGAVTLTAVSCAATVVAVAALVGVVTAAPPHAIGAAAGLASLGMVAAAARVSIVLAGLSTRLLWTPAMDETDADEWRLRERARRADAWLSSLLAGFSSAAAVGAIVTVLAGAPRLSCMAFGGITGALLLLRARCADGGRMVTFIAAGIAVVGVTFGVTAFGAPGQGPWVAVATAMLAGAAMYLGFVAPAVTPPLLVRRAIDALEWLSLVALVPLTCWLCGLYGVARGLNLR
ncbi:MULTISPECIES: type VII secretion integral membrane protein EccD [unclassified Mycobacterium]|uniref:type VII secretion integral membrane protein EccD n=1 Tax=unclassified Mycobacterium TaxID=2642494 RepID=UPI0006DCE732|nr:MULTISPECIES: type VII secretion integral membrane protein EccD [unclassified Mycobacterium]